MYRFTRILVANYRRINSTRNHVEFVPKKQTTRNFFVMGSTTAAFLNFLGFKSKDEAVNEEQELIMTIKRGVLSTQRSEFDKAEQLYHLALRSAQTLQNQLAVTYIYDLMANLAYEIGQLEKAEKIFVDVMKRLLEEKAQEDDIRLLHISSKVAHIAYLQGDMDKALLGYDYVLEKIQKRDYLNEENYHELYGIVKNLIGQAFIALKRFPEAKSALLEAQIILKKYKDEVTEDGMILLNNLSCTCAELKEYSSAQDYLKQAIEIAKKINIDDVSPYHINLGMLYFKQKLFKKAQESCSQGWKISKQHENKEANEAANRCLDEVKKAM